MVVELVLLSVILVTIKYRKLFGLPSCSGKD